MRYAARAKYKRPRAARYFKRGRRRAAISRETS